MLLVSITNQNFGEIQNRSGQNATSNLGKTITSIKD